VYAIKTICEAVSGRFLQQATYSPSHLVYDSRRVQVAAESLFLHWLPPTNDGHKFLAPAHKLGVRNFIVQQDVALDQLPDSNVIQVPDTLQALQELAAFHRQHFQIPILGITGSNGKTVVKEWLFQLLQDDYNIVRSPKSFNSQIGVPLSVWGLAEPHTLGIFEAGISQPGEMEKLAHIIQPTIGVLTNLGTAHDEGFPSQNEKLHEKIKLFQDADVVIGNAELLTGKISPERLFTWSRTAEATVQVVKTEVTENGTDIYILHGEKLFQIPIPFSDKASVENAITCICVLLYLKSDLQKKQPTFSNLHAVDMRLQLTRGINGCTLVNDSYSADLTSLHIALSFLRQQSTGQKRTAILSDFFESGRSSEVLYQHIAALMQHYKIEKVVGDR
jgi:UDP-N-acetylmuramoyl-tripeptide--D-alanyl-D-alanine ligase